MGQFQVLIEDFLNFYDYDFAAAATATGRNYVSINELCFRVFKVHAWDLDDMVHSLKVIPVHIGMSIIH